MWSNCVQDVRKHFGKSLYFWLSSILIWGCSWSVVVLWRGMKSWRETLTSTWARGGRDDLLSNPLYITPHGVYSSHKICHQIWGRGCWSHSFPLSHYPVLFLSKACRISLLNFELGDHHVHLKMELEKNGDAEVCRNNKWLLTDNAFYNDECKMLPLSPCCIRMVWSALLW